MLWDTGIWQKKLNIFEISPKEVIDTDMDIFVLPQMYVHMKAVSAMFNMNCGLNMTCFLCIMIYLMLEIAQCMWLGYRLHNQEM